MSEDLWTDHVKLESPSILTKKNSFFARPLGNGAARNFLVNPISGRGVPPPLAAPVAVPVLSCDAAIC